MPTRRTRVQETKPPYRARRKAAAREGQRATTLVALRLDVAEQVRAEAERRQVSVEDLVNDWLEYQLWEGRNKKIIEESERYQARHAELYAQYAGKVIAMRDGEVVEVGDEFMEVYRHVRARFGNAAVMITEVEKEPVKTYTILSPRLERFPDDHEIS